MLAAFVATDGRNLGPNTWTEIALVVIAAAVGGWVLAAGDRAPAWGLLPVIAFIGVAALTAVSVLWSVAPDTSWIEAGRTAAYLACFGAAAGLARLLPSRWQVIVLGVLIAATAVSAWALLVKVFAWSFDGQTGSGRLLAPFGYQNATGVMAAIGLPAAIWAGSRRDGPRLGIPAAAAASTVLITVVVLTYSRSAVLAAVFGAAVPLAIGNVRLRSVLALALGGAGAAVVCGWALSDHGITGNAGVSAAARGSAGHALGIVLVVVLAAVAIAAAVIEARGQAVPVSEARRRQIGTVLIGLVALVPVLAAIALVVSNRGFTGELSHLWHKLTSATTSVGNTADRLGNAANSRPAYWHQALSVASHHLLAGAGSGGFGVAHLAYSTRNLLGNTAESTNTHAHSYVMQTFADFGVLGLAATLALLLTWERPSAGRSRGVGPLALPTLRRPAPSATGWSHCSASRSPMASARRSTGPGSTPV